MTVSARWAAGALAAALLTGSADAQPLGHLDAGAPAPAFSAEGADGRRHALTDFTDRVVVLEWTSPVCPYTAAKYRSGAIQALQRRARLLGVVWLSIDTAAPGRAGYLSAAAARARLARIHARVTAFLFDKDGAIGRRYGAKVTPSFFIVGRDGKLAYQGAMDDAAPSPDARARNYVGEALDDLAEGRAVRTTQAPAYGCALEY